MPLTFKDISKKAEVSHMLGIITYHVADSLYNKVQGGFENVAHSLVIDDAFFTTEVLSHSLNFDDVNAVPVELTFT